MSSWALHKFTDGTTTRWFGAHLFFLERSRRVVERAEALERGVGRGGSGAIKSGHGGQERQRQGRHVTSASQICANTAVGQRDASAAGAPRRGGRGRWRWWVHRGRREQARPRSPATPPAPDRGELCFCQQDKPIEMGGLGWRVRKADARRGKAHLFVLARGAADGGPPSLSLAVSPRFLRPRGLGSGGCLARRQTRPTYVRVLYGAESLAE